MMLVLQPGNVIDPDWTAWQARNRGSPTITIARAHQPTNCKLISCHRCRHFLDLTPSGADGPGQSHFDRTPEPASGNSLTSSIIKPTPVFGVFPSICCSHEATIAHDRE